MFGFRILLFIVAYVVVLAEMIVGNGSTKSALQGAPWIIPGALVIALLPCHIEFHARQSGRPGGSAPASESDALDHHAWRGAADLGCLAPSLCTIF